MLTVPKPYDLEVARQIALLKRWGLQIHIPKRGPAYFTKNPEPEKRMLDKVPVCKLKR